MFQNKKPQIQRTFKFNMFSQLIYKKNIYMDKKNTDTSTAHQRCETLL